MKATLGSILALLADLGFTAHEQYPDHRPYMSGPAELIYLYRESGGRHQYVSVLTYDGQLTEVVHETYRVRLQPKRATKRLSVEASQAQGYTPYVTGIARTVDGLRDALA